jgi:hypothetical protein
MDKDSYRGANKNLLTSWRSQKNRDVKNNNTLIEREKKGIIRNTPE